MHFIALAATGSDINPILLVAAGFVGGFAVGLTGMGGGALMTPGLVLLFGVDPKVAVASDLVNSLIMKPIGGSVHMRRGTIQWPLVRHLVIGSVPAAFLGAFLLNTLGGPEVETQIKRLLGWALLVASTAIVAKAVLSARAQRRAEALSHEPGQLPKAVKPVATVLVGVAGGIIVGMTSVGSGSLMIVLLMLLYPRLTSRSLVGTDLVQAVPLVASAALGQLIFGHVDVALTGALVVGSLPGVYVGARLSSSAPDRIVRPVLVSILVMSALALLLPSYSALAWSLLLAAMMAVPLWGAIDATLRPADDWKKARRSRTRWVAAQGVGAPFGIGLVASIGYFGKVRKEVARGGTAARPEAPEGEPAG